MVPVLGRVAAGGGGKTDSAALAAATAAKEYELDQFNDSTQTTPPQQVWWRLGSLTTHTRMEPQGEMVSGGIALDEDVEMALQEAYAQRDCVENLKNKLRSHTISHEQSHSPLTSSCPEDYSLVCLSLSPSLITGESSSSRSVRVRGQRRRSSRRTVSS